MLAAGREIQIDMSCRQQGARCNICCCRLLSRRKQLEMQHDIVTSVALRDETSRHHVGIRARDATYAAADSARDVVMSAAGREILSCRQQLEMQQIYISAAARDATNIHIGSRARCNKEILPRRQLHKMQHIDIVMLTNTFMLQSFSSPF